MGLDAYDVEANHDEVQEGEGSPDGDHAPPP